MVPGAVGRHPRRPRGLPKGFPPKAATHIARKPWRWPLDLDPRQGSEPHNSPVGSGLVLFHRRNRIRPQCHIADALAELVSYLSIVPHMRSSDVPPKHSARGAFFPPLDFLRREPPPNRSLNPGQISQRKLRWGGAEFLGTKGAASLPPVRIGQTRMSLSGRHHVTASGTSRFPHLLC